MGISIFSSGCLGSQSDCIHFNAGLTEGQFEGMLPGGRMQLQKKVYAYIVREDQILVFRHVDFPEAGLQVPGGTVEPGETPSAAVRREAAEETGLRGLRLVGLLGQVCRDMREFGLASLHERYYFLMNLENLAPARWVHDETDPSDGSAGPIALEFFWTSLDDMPHLSGGLDEMLPQLNEKLKGGIDGVQ
jgi:ADP-ribose pyrophosphatase YjhB (NUDIX family)